MTTPPIDALDWWNSLRHSGLLVDRKRLAELYAEKNFVVSPEIAERLRETVELGHARSKGAALELVDFVLEEVCGFQDGWKKGSKIDASWTRRDREGVALRPDRLWQGLNGALLPVFIDKDSKTLGLGRGRRFISRVVRWMRSGSEKVAVVTNGRQWRILHAGLDYEAWCESDSELWFEDGYPSFQLIGLGALLSPGVWIPDKKGERYPLLRAIEETRKGQADLSSSLGERVRIAVENLIDAHKEALDEHAEDIPPAEVYRAAVRIIMRIVVVLFAEARGLLPIDNATYHTSYGLRGLHDQLRRLRRTQRIADSRSAWPRLLALFRLVHDGSSHPDLSVMSYGGELFQPGDEKSADGLQRAIWIFENACFKDDAHSVPDGVIESILEHLTRTTERIRSGRGTIAVPVPVDFSDLSSEYIGVLYEGLLDYELKQVPEGEAVIILPAGNRPALPLSRLEAMDDSKLGELIAKFAKDAKSKDSGEENESEDGEEETEEEIDDEPEELVAAEVTEQTEEPEEQALAADADLGRRVTVFLQRLVEKGKLVPKPRGKAPEKLEAYKRDIERKSLSLARDVHYPGKRYLVRWGGTRKGSGTFYTRPGLSGPLIHRTLAPLAYIAPCNEGRGENRDLPLSEWTPRKPEEILALKVCDIACGSGTFPVGALRFLTQALWDALNYHKRILPDADKRTIVALFGEAEAKERIGDEFLPCLPDDETYESRLRSLLKRHVAERCIYAVDFDPLAVELCRLAVWIETLDPELPFSFLDHKIKCGNSLVGCWHDRYQRYPDLAFKRAAGDEKHSTAVNCPKDEGTKAIGAFYKKAIKPNLSLAASSQGDLFLDPTQSRPESIHARLRNKLSYLHSLDIHSSMERRLAYGELATDHEFVHLKRRYDLWCSMWFWPASQLDTVPLPTDFGRFPEAAQQISERIAAQHRFFHWELEFPDVFSSPQSGFDAILGNPPWETLQPNSKEFFSDIDPLYRTYSNQAALQAQRQLFTDERVERRWLAYKDIFKSYVNWLAYAGQPFSVSSPNASSSLSDPRHPFVLQGTGKPYTYKMFTEVAFALLKHGGALGFILPSSIYADHGSRQLRDCLIRESQFEYLFGFDNREKIFDIDSRYKFNPFICSKGGTTNRIRTTFGQQRLEAWADAETYLTSYPVTQIEAFSPKAHALIEIRSDSDLKLAKKIYANSCTLGSLSQSPWSVRYSQGDLNMTSASKSLVAVDKLLGAGATRDVYGRLHSTAPDGGRVECFPVYEGKAIWQHDAAYAAPAHPGSKTWSPLPWTQKQIHSRYAIPSELYESKFVAKLVMRDVSSPTNMRTFVACVVPDYPCGHKVPILCRCTSDPTPILVLATVLNSLTFDFITRLRFAPSGGGGSLIWSIVEELPIWNPNAHPHEFLECVAAVGGALTGGLPCFGPLYALLSDKQAYFVTESVQRQGPVERLRLLCLADALNARAFGLNLEDFLHIVDQCWHPAAYLRGGRSATALFPKLFWRVDKEHPPEERQTMLSLIALQELVKLESALGNLAAAAAALIGFDGGAGWQVPDAISARQWSELGVPLTAEEQVVEP
jgi:hypothetical protein